MKKKEIRSKCWRNMWIGLIILVSFGHLTHGCGSGDIGTADPSSHTDTTGSNTDGRTFFMGGAPSPCCGTLSNWKFYASSAGTITAMIWRPTSGSNYRLISMEDFTVASTGLSTPIPSSTQQLETGDVIGWKTSGNELIPYSSTVGAGTQNQLLNPTVNTVVPWSQTPDTTKTYAFGAVVNPNEVPTVTGGSVTIQETDTSQTVFTLTVADADAVDLLNDDTVAITASSPTTSEFSINTVSPNFVIESGASLTPGTYELEIKVTDVCLETATATVTITVENPAPVFDPGTPDTAYPTEISDATTTATSLYAFSVTDNDPITCTTDNSLFEIKDVPPNKEIWLKAVSAADLNYDSAASQTMTITCTDGTTPITRSYNVSLSDEPPVLTAGTAPSPVGDLSAIGTSVYQFTVTDQDDIVTCTVDAPENAQFSITALDGTAGTQRYDIVTASLLDEDAIASYTVTVSCDDGRNTPVTETKTITLTDEQPILTGLDFTASSIADGLQSTSTVLGSFTVTDANDEDVITCSIAAPEATLFELTGTAPNFNVQTKSGQTLSAASSPYLLSITCDDDEVGVNTVSGTATVPVSDNPPTFVGAFPASSSPLSDDTVTETSLAAFTVSDPDASCSITDPVTTVYEIRTVATPADANQPEFEIWVANTVTEADIDYNDQPVPLTLTIECTDGTTTISDTFDVNIVDAAPVLTGLPGTDYDGLSDATTTAAQLDVFNVTDSDDTITCAVDPGDPSAASFEVRAGTPPEFQIWVKDNPGLNYDVTPSYTLPITCTDGVTADIVTGAKTVNLISSPPVFVDMPATLSPAISDATNTETLLHSFSVTDTPTATITCSFTAPAPYDDDFDVRGAPSPDYEIYLLATNDLNYDNAASVNVTVTCTDGTTPVTEDFTVDIFDEDPVWTGLPGAAPYQFISDTEPVATSLYMFSVEDSDDVISCEVDSGTPEATSFEVRAGTAPEFEIWYKGTPPATLDYDVALSHNLSVVCNDGAAYSQTEIYQVDLENAPPTFVNLPDAVSATISESETSKVSLFTVSASDSTELTCYLADTVVAAGIEPLEKGTVALPITEYVVYGWHQTGFDFESSSGAITVDISCGDSVTTITETLTVTITNSAPVILNPGGSANVSEEETGAVTLKTTKLEKFDETATCSMTNNDGGPFAVTNNQVVKTAGALDYETKAVYNLQISCTDGILTTTDTYKVYVQNTGPEITNIVFGVDIPEEQTDELRLIDVSTSEDATLCTQVAPTESEFVVKYEPTTSLWSIYYVSEVVAGKRLNYEVKPSYNINVVCTDSSGAQGAPKAFTINVIDNEAPVFDNIGGSITTNQELIAKDFSASDTVFTVAATDPSSPADAVTYSLLSCTPNATCPFIMTPNGDIITTQDLHSYPDDVYTLSVQATDKYNPNNPPADLILRIIDRNTIPTFTNLPKKDVVGVMENQYAAGDTVFTISAYDPDTTDTLTTPDTLTYYCDFTDGGEAYFYCDPDTGEIKAVGPIDYETVTQLSYRVEVYVNDGYADSELQQLTLRINDENEPPTFRTSSWTISKPDEGGPGETVGCPDFDTDIDDEDTNDDHKYTMSCPRGAGAFVMDKDTGCVTMLKEWDLDAASKRLGVDTITCTVTATDKGGLTTTTTLNIKINEEDDNKPYLDQTSYMFCATVGTTSGSLGTVSVSDNDVLAKHRKHTYEFIGNGPFSSDGSGNLVYGDISNYAKGTSFETVLRVTDEAGNYDESPVTVVICDPPSSSSSSSGSGTGSSSSSSTSSSESMLMWLIPAILLSVLMLGLAAFLLRRYCLNGACRCRPCLKSSPTPAKSLHPVQTVRSNPARPAPRQQVIRRVSPSPEPPKKEPPGQIAPMELPITHYWARDRGNLGAAYPTV